MQQPVKYFYKRLNSTNLYVSQLLAKNRLKLPFWVRSDDQYDGKGQGSNTWISEPGQNLTGTLAVFPERFEASRQFDLSKVFALAAASFLELFIDGVTLKWPNDLYAGDKKIGGILIETAILGNLIDHAILGAGINVNQQTFPDNIPNPVSISMLTGLQYNLGEMEDLFLASFLNEYQLVECGNFKKINQQYINKLYRFGEDSSFKANNEVFSAKILGVNEFGHLLLQTASGSVDSFAYQEVSYVL